MNTILFLILIASFGVIGDVQWARALVAAVKAKKDWAWPLITGLLSVAVGLAAAVVWPVLEDSTLKAGLLLWPIVTFLTLATVQLGYDVVIKTFLHLIEGLGNLVAGTDQPPYRSVEGTNKKEP